MIRKLALTFLITLSFNLNASAVLNTNNDNSSVIDSKLIAESLDVDTLDIDGTISLPAASLEIADIDVSVANDGDILQVVALNQLGFAPFSGFSAGSVSTNDFQTGSVTENKLADSAITEFKFAAGSVTTQKLADQAVSNAKIANLNITNAKIQDNQISGQKIANNQIQTSNIEDAAITFDKVQNPAVLNQPLTGLSINSATFFGVSPLNNIITNISRLAGNVLNIQARADNNTATIDEILDPVNPRPVNRALTADALFNGFIGKERISNVSGTGLAVRNNRPFLSGTEINSATIDGFINFPLNVPPPAVPGLMYFDQSSRTLKISEDGSTYVDVVGSTVVDDGDWTQIGDDLQMASSGNVGVGIASPGEKLDVQGNVQATIFQGSAAQITNLPAARSAGWIKDTNTVRIDSQSKRVGIGIDNPTAKLHLAGEVFIDQGNITLDAGRSIGESLDNTKLTFNTDNITADSDGEIHYIIDSNNSAGTSRFNVFTKNNPAPIFTITEDGKMGINDPNPVNTVDVDGDVFFINRLFTPDGSALTGVKLPPSKVKFVCTHQFSGNTCNFGRRCVQAELSGGTPVACDAPGLKFRLYCCGVNIDPS